MREYRDYQEPFYEYGVGKRASVVRALIVANIVVFALQFVLRLFVGIDLERWLGLDPKAATQGLRVWQFLTYMFLHAYEHIWHIIFNMLFLYWFGAEIEPLYGPKRFLSLYLGAGLFAGLVFAFYYYASPFGSIVVGASGAVMAVLVVFAIHFPDREILFMFLFPMKVKWLVLLLIGADLYYEMAQVWRGTAGICHLAGAGFGLAFYKLHPLVEGYFESLGQRLEERERLDDRRFDEEVDEILAKVHREGMASLSRREKDLLLKASKKYRAR